MSDGPEVEDLEDAKQAIYYALNTEDYTVLEFTKLDTGQVSIADITEHVRQLERMHTDQDPKEPIDEQ